MYRQKTLDAGRWVKHFKIPLLEGLGVGKSKEAEGRRQKAEGRRQ